MYSNSERHTMLDNCKLLSPFIFLLWQALIVISATLSSRTLARPSSQRSRSRAGRSRTPIGRKDGARPTSIEPSGNGSNKKGSKLSSNANKSKAKIKWVIFSLFNFVYNAGTYHSIITVNQGYFERSCFNMTGAVLDIGHLNSSKTCL